MRFLLYRSKTGQGPAWPKTSHVCVFLWAAIFCSNHLQAQFFSCAYDTISYADAEISYSVAPLPGDNDDWEVTFFSNTQKLEDIDLHSFDLQLQFRSPLFGGSSISLEKGTHLFNDDGLSTWKGGMGPNKESLRIHGARPPCEGKKGQGSVVKVRLFDTGITDSNDLILSIDGIVIAEVVVGAKSCFQVVTPSPNPAQTYVDLPTSSCNGARALIFDSGGQLVLSQAILPGSRNRVYLTQLQPGFYLVRMEVLGNNDQLFFNLIKQ